VYNPCMHPYQRIFLDLLPSTYTMIDRLGPHDPCAAPTYPLRLCIKNRLSPICTAIDRFGVRLALDTFRRRICSPADPKAKDAYSPLHTEGRRKGSRYAAIVR